jgi:hypothetical protein
MLGFLLAEDRAAEPARELRKTGSEETEEVVYRNS